MDVCGKTQPAPQVGGHAGVSTSEDGSLLIKPALVHELEFYERLNSDPALAPLRPHIPKFYGTLRFEGKVEGGNLETFREAQNKGKDECSAAWTATPVFMTAIHSIVLENLANRFSRPNILDIKLGTQLYDDEASEEKKARMIQAAKATTSLQTGVRLTGFQVHDTSTGQAVNTPKAYGKSIKPSELPDGIAKFFPVHSEQSTLGLPKEQILPVLEAIRKRVVAIRDAFAQVEMRTVGGSLLIIYENDLERVRQAINLLEEDGEEEEDDEDEDAEGEEEEDTKPGPACLVKLIDFAHTKLVAGEGPDEGVLLGLDTTLRLLDGRVSEIKVS